jgi:hypothetical protein
MASRREEDAALKKWPKPRLCCANNGILETKAPQGNGRPPCGPKKKKVPRAISISAMRLSNLL